MKINSKKILVLLMSFTLTFTSLGCNKEEKVKEPVKQVEMKKEEAPLKEETTNVNVFVEEKPSEENHLTEENSSEVNDVTEENVIQYFENIESEIDTMLENEDKSIIEKIEEKCAYFVLFMAGEKEIKGYTWSELTDETKEKIVEIFINVDEKVSNKYPDYMEKIKKYSKKASVFITDTYQKIKQETSFYLDENVDEETKKSFKDGYEDMKDSFQKTKENIKDWARKNYN